MFDDWVVDADYPTLFQVDRPVTVNTAEALPSDTRKFADQHPAWLRAFGLRVDPVMPGRQLAWIRRCDGTWLAFVVVSCSSGNSHSRLAMLLWVASSDTAVD